LKYLGVPDSGGIEQGLGGHVDKRRSVRGHPLLGGNTGQEVLEINKIAFGGVAWRDAEFYQNPEGDQSEGFLTFQRSKVSGG